MIALDVSRNMLSQDVERAALKSKTIVYLMDELQNDRIGLVILPAGHVQMPLTADHSNVVHINNASPEAVPTQGTVVAGSVLDR